MTESRSVSDKDIDAAVNMLYDTPCLNETVTGEWHKPTMGTAIKIVGSLISHGWGPQPAGQGREEMIDAYALHLAFGNAEVAEGFRDDAMPVIDWCISQGWGPRPTVALAKLGEIIDGFAHACPHCPKGKPEWIVLYGQVTDIVRECGIEVVS